MCVAGKSSISPGKRLATAASPNWKPPSTATAISCWRCCGSRSAGGCPPFRAVVGSDFARSAAGLGLGGRWLRFRSQPSPCTPARRAVLHPRQDRSTHRETSHGLPPPPHATTTKQELWPLWSTLAGGDRHLDAEATLDQHG